MRHASPFTQILLAPAMALSPLRRALVSPPRLSTALSIAQRAAALFAVALPPVVPEANMEDHAALEALDFDEVDRARACHAAARRTSTTRCASARLYPSRGRASTSLRRLPGRPVPGRPGASTSPAPSLPPPVPHPAPTARPTTRTPSGLG